MPFDPAKPAPGNDLDAILIRRRQRGRKRLMPKGVEVHFARHTEA